MLQMHELHVCFFAKWSCNKFLTSKGYFLQKLIILIYSLKQKNMKIGFARNYELLMVHGFCKNLGFFAKNYEQKFKLFLQKIIRL